MTPRAAVTALISACFAAFACSTSSPSPAPATTAGNGATGADVSGGSAGQNSSGTAGQGGASTNAGTGGTPVSGTGGVSSGAGGSSGNGGSGGAELGPPFGHPDPAVVYPVYDGFTLWVVEEFDEPLDLDNDPIWTWSDGGFSTHRFRREAITFEQGKMVITLSDTPQASSCSYANTGIVPERARTSGELRSRHNWFRYGRYEATFKAPSVQPGNTTINGNYIASLFTYRHPGCQEWREIDLEVTGDSPNHLGTNLITSTLDCAFTPDKEQPQFFDLEGIDFRTGFQTVGFEWLPGSIKFYYLGEGGTYTEIRTITGDKVPTMSAKIMANLWMFDDSFAFGGPEGANNMLPFRAEYDSLRFYRWNEDTEYPCADMSTGCLKAEDVDLAANNACDGIGLTGDVATCPQCGTTVRAICDDLCE